MAAVTAPGSPRFATTRWTVVLAAGEATSQAARAALEELCRAYWFPLYAFARREGASPELAQDLVQGFFAHALEKGTVGAADPARGRFRSFLLTSFRNYTKNERARDQALKRGGGATLLSIGPDAEGRLGVEPWHEETPEQRFEREWALGLLERALGAVRASYAGRGQQAVFDALKGFLVGQDDRRYAEAGASLGLSEGAVKVAVHRLRDRYRRALRDEVAQTVEDEAQVEDELGALLGALSRGSRA